jgi:hypothetical protein
MARARNIKPGFFHDAKLLKCEAWVRLLFIGLWCQADRRGILRDDPEQLAVDIFPRDAYDVQAGLCALTDAGFLVRYQSQGQRCIKIVNFLRHQNPHRDEKPSDLPDEQGASMVLTLCEHPVNRADSLNTDSLIADTGLLEPPLVPPAGGKPKVKRKTVRATQVPEDWEPSDDLCGWASEQGFLSTEVHAQTVQFIRHHRSKGNTFKDIGMAWQNWMARSREYGPARASPNGKPMTSTDRILEAGRRVQERHNERDRNHADAGDVRRSLWPEDERGGPGHDARHRGLDDGPRERAVDAVWREHRE